MQRCQHWPQEEYLLKVDIPRSQGDLRIEDFLDWLAEAERFFENIEILDDRKVKLEAIHPRGRPSAWWQKRAEQSPPTE